MRSDQYLHPELGFLAPTARLRRELRLGVLSMLFGVGIGVVAVTALSLGSRDQDGSAHSAGTGGTVGTALGASESIPLPREKPRKAVGRNALRQAELNGHEDSGNIWTGRGDGRQTTRPRAPSHDSSRSLRGFWAWSW